jgi:hypothetical protein
VNSPSSEGVWNALGLLSEGTVSEMAVSFDTTYSTNEIKDLLKDYDLDITWYAVYTGLEDKIDAGTPLFAFHGVWGFADSSYSTPSNTTINLDEVIGEKYFLDNMQFLTENQKIIKKIYRGNPTQLRLDERYNYLQNNGIKVYGVVVTGPSKELLKLRDLSFIQHPALGDVALYNWFNRNFSGEMY